MADVNAKLNVLIALRSVVQDGERPTEWLKKFSAGLVAAGGAMAVLATKHSLDLAGRIQDLSTQASMSAQAFQAFATTGAEFGLGMESIAKASEHLRKSLQEARENGASPLNAALASLKLSAAGLQTLAPEYQWEEIARAVGHATDKQAALNAASALFGEKQLPKLKELLDRLNAEGYEKIFESTKKLRISDEDLKTLDDAGDKLTRIKNELLGFGAKAVSGALNAMFGPVMDAADPKNQIDILQKRVDSYLEHGFTKADPRVAEYLRTIEALKAKIADREAIASSPQAEKQLQVQDQAARNREKGRREDMEEAAEAERKRLQAKVDNERENALRTEREEREARELNALQDDAARVIESVKTPLQEYNDELRRLGNHLAEKRIGEEEFARAVDAANMKFAKATSLHEAEVRLNDRLLELSQRRAEVDSDFTRTEAEKWASRRAMLQEEIGLREQSIKNLTAIRAARKGDGDPTELDARIRGEVEGLAGLGGQLAGMAPNPNSLFEQMKAGLTSLREAWGTTTQQIAGGITGAIGTAVDTVTSSVTRALVVTNDWREAWNNIALAVETQVVQALVGLGVRWIATQLMMATAGKAIGAAATAATAPIAAAQSAIWAAPATLASIATLGGAAAQAPLSISGAIGMTQLLSMFSAYADGGAVTGGKQLAWLNEEGPEFVFSAPAVRALGSDNLDAMHRAALSTSGHTAPISARTKDTRVILVDERERDLIGRLISDPRFENQVRRIGRKNSEGF